MLGFPAGPDRSGRKECGRPASPRSSESLTVPNEWLACASSPLLNSVPALTAVASTLCAEIGSSQCRRMLTVGDQSASGLVVQISRREISQASSQSTERCLAPILIQPSTLLASSSLAVSLVP